MQEPDKKVSGDEDTRETDFGGTLPLPSEKKADRPDFRTIEYSAPVGGDSGTDSNAGNDSVIPTQSQTSPNAPAVPTNEDIPGFRIIKELGRGAFGVVYKAIDERLDRSVAIKLPLLKDVKLYERYIVEARNAAKVEAQGIVPVLQIGTASNGQPFVVQKMIDGSTLAELISAEDSLPVDQAVELAYKLANAIACAHSAGLVHRDLKPANIIIDGDGEPWIADFGLAVFEEEQKFRTGEVAGTPAYMAPEQFLGRADWLDGRADIWALGIILHLMLTGKLPFEAADFEKLKEQIFHRDPRPLNQRLPHIPMELDFVFRKCCAKAIKDRYSSAYQLADELLEFLQKWTDNTELNASQRSRRQPMLAQRRFMGQQTVREEQSSQASVSKTENVPAKTWPIVAATLVVGASLIIGGVVLSKADWFSRGSESAEGAVEIDRDAIEPVIPPKASLQLRVSHAGTGSHSTIAEALSAAEAGATIFIDAGTYRENLVINRNVELRGEGAETDVKILGTDASAIRLVASSSLKLANLTIEAVGAEINTIEVQDGSLEMSRCVVKSKSLDCIIVRPKSQLRVLGDCVFQSGLHPAIFADGAAVVEIRSSSFTFDPTIDTSDDPVVGIQVRRCGGVVSGCTFSGHPQATGIDWADAKDRAIISECQFNELLQGIAARNCEKLQIIGKADNQLQSCKYGIVAEACQGLISQTAIFGGREKSSVGIKIGNSENLEIKEIRFIAMDVGLELQASQVRGEAITIKQSGEYGILLHENAILNLMDSEVAQTSQTGVYLIDKSKLTMQKCKVLDNELAGVWVDTEGEAFSATACQISGNGIGLVLTSGSTTIEEGKIANNRTIGVLVRKPIASSTAPDDLERKPVVLSARGARFEAAETTETTKGIFTAAIYFTTEGNFTLANCEVIDAGHANQVFLAPNLTTQEKDGVSLVREK